MRLLHPPTDLFILLAAPEARVVEGVQVGGVGPSHVGSFTPQLQAPPRGQGRARTQPEEAAFIQNLSQQRLAFAFPLAQVGVTGPHPFPAWALWVLAHIFSALDCLAGTCMHRGTEEGGEQLSQHSDRKEVILQTSKIQPLRLLCFHQQKFVVFLQMQHRLKHEGKVSIITNICCIPSYLTGFAETLEKKSRSVHVCTVLTCQKQQITSCRSSDQD